MGGGGAMRAASKVANFAYIGGGFRGAPSVPLQEHSTTTAISGATTKTLPNPEKLITDSSPNGELKSSSSVQKTSWDFDDWAFTDDGGDEILLSSSKQSMPRVIFGEVPTFEEAKEATFDLKGALEKSSSIVTQEPGLEFSETKACVTSETMLAMLAFPSMSKPVFQAFSLLKKSPEAQNVVASLASDKNVWDAVIQNEKVMKFLKLQQTDKEFYDDKKPSMSFDDGNDVNHSESFGNVFVKSIENLKLSVMEMMSNLSLFFQELFGGQEASNVSLDANGNATATNIGRIMGGSFMALAVMTIIIVVLKRG